MGNQESAPGDNIYQDESKYIRITDVHLSKLNPTIGSSVGSVKITPLANLFLPPTVEEIKRIEDAKKRSDAKLNSIAEEKETTENYYRHVKVKPRKTGLEEPKHFTFTTDRPSTPKAITAPVPDKFNDLATAGVVIISGEEKPVNIISGEGVKRIIESKSAITVMAKQKALVKEKTLAKAELSKAMFGDAELKSRKIKKKAEIQHLVNPKHHKLAPHRGR